MSKSKNEQSMTQTSSAQRKTYIKPSLESLGQVRDVVLDAGGGSVDLYGTQPTL